MVDQSARVRDVVGGKAAAVLEKAFGIHTAGDLLRHYPRRYYERGELTDLAELRRRRAGHAAGRRWSRSTPARSAPSCTRPTSRSPTAPARCSSTFFNRRTCRSALEPGAGDHASPARSSCSTARCSSSSRRSRSTPSGMAEDAGTLMPVYPATQGAAVLVDPRGDPHRAGHGRRPRDAARAEIRTARELIGRAEALRGSTARRTGRRSRWRRSGSGTTRRSSCRSCSRSGGCSPRSSRRRPARRAPGGLLEAFDATLPFTLTAGQQRGRRRAHGRSCRSRCRCTGCCRARSAPARRWSRCARCSPWSTPAGRPRCSRRPRCLRSSTPGRSTRCSARSAVRASSAQPTARPGSPSSPAR